MRELYPNRSVPEGMSSSSKEHAQASHCISMVLYYDPPGKNMDFASRVRGNWFIVAQLNPNGLAKTRVLHHARSGPGSFTKPEPMFTLFSDGFGDDAATMCVVRAIQVGSKCEAYVWF